MIRSFLRRSRYLPLQRNHLPAAGLPGSYLPERFRVLWADQFTVMLEKSPALGVARAVSASLPRPGGMPNGNWQMCRRAFCGHF